MFSVRTKILVVALATILIAMATFAAVMIESLRSSTREAEAQQLGRLHLSYREAMWWQQKGCRAVLEALAWRPDVRKAMAGRDRDDLQMLLEPTFRELRKSLGAVQLYVHEPDGVVLLRVHAPDERGDVYVSHRPMVLDALRTRSTVSGIELDSGRMSLRTVTPVMQRDRTIGLLEIGIDYDEGLLQEIKTRRGADARIWLRYDAAGPTGLWPKPDAPKAPTPEVFLYVSTFAAERPMPAQVYQQVMQQGRPIIEFVRDAGEQYGSMAAPLHDFAGKTIGVLEVSRSRDEALTVFHRGMLITVLVAALVAAGGVAAIALTLRYVVILPLRRLTSAARRQYEGDLQARVQHRSTDEFGLLADTFNSLSNRLTQLIEQQRQTIEQVGKARHAAEEANAAKDQFLAALSHELRTPLTPALLTAESLEMNPDLPDGFREHAHTIRRSVELEARLIDDLLDLTRIARGKLELQTSVSDLHSLLATTIAVCRSDIDAKRLELTTEFEAQHFHVQGDPARLQQVFWNLIKNAVKFTPEGGTVMVSTSNVETGKGTQFVLRVADNGIGMDATTLERIFNTFEQGSREITRTFGGLGLGLAISKRLLELHHGQIIACSPGVGKGSIFTAFLPTVPAPAMTVTRARPRMPAVESPSAGVRPQRILMVEDHAVTGRVIAKLLRDQGHQVQLGKCIADGLELAREHPFDIVISDLGLPDGHGTELMRQLRDKYGLRGIAVSGYGMQDDIQRSLDAGFLIHLTKPVTADALKSAIAEVAVVTGKP